MHPTKTPPILRVLAVMALVLALAALAGCGGKNTPEPAEEAAPTAVAEVEVSPTEPADTADEPTAEPEPTTEPEPTVEAQTDDQETLQLSDRTSGLDQLISYRLTWSMAWEGEEDGKARQVSWDWQQENTKEPAAQHLSMKTTDSDATKSGTFEVYSIGDTTYLLSNDSGEQKCVPMTSADQDKENAPFNPSLLGSLNDAKYVGKETVNGIPAKHYTYDERATPLFGGGKTTGEVWVAEDGGYVVKESVQWEGTANFLGAGEGTGKGHWDWELTDANADFTINPPEGCESAAGGLPVMDDATEKSSLGDMLMYKTQAKPADVLDFYKKAMEAAGWTLDGEPSTMEGLVQAAFKKDGQQAQLMIMTDDSGTQVIINVSKE